MPYKSPITVSFTETNKFLESFQMDAESAIVRAVRAVMTQDIVIDKEELARALKGHHEQYKKGYEEGFQDGAATLWTPVTERLPDHENHVLCCTATTKGRKNIVIGYYCHDLARWASGMNSNVIAWMPLPEPYEEAADV